MNPKSRNDSGWQDYPTRFAPASALSQARETEALQTKLKQVAIAAQLAFDDCWVEFKRRCATNGIRANLNMDDLIWDIQADRWPKRRKKK